MLKLVLHVVVASLIWAGVSSLGLGWVVMVIALLLGAVLVHVIWERVFFQAFAYLGAMPVADDDPLILAAYARALETRPAFLRAYPHHRDDAMVKFRVRTPSGASEQVWADLVEIVGETAKVYVRTYPTERSPDFEPSQTISVEEILDWQIERRDGTLLGGYTNRALFKIFERSEGYMHPKFLEHVERFREIDDSSEEPAARID